jgi:hypothetical protein
MLMLQIEETKEFHFVEIHPKRKKSAPELDTIKMLLKQAFESSSTDEDLELQYKEWMVKSENTFSDLAQGIKFLDKTVKEVSAPKLKSGSSNLRPATIIILHS